MKGSGMAVGKNNGICAKEGWKMPKNQKARSKKTVKAGSGRSRSADPKQTETPIDIDKGDAAKIIEFYKMLKNSRDQDRQKDFLSYGVIIK
jgi:hypothetical protein